MRGGRWFAAPRPLGGFEALTAYTYGSECMFPALLLAAATVAPAGDVIQVRGGLLWTDAMITKGAPVRVVFFGGSITENPGYRPRVEAGLRGRFPDVNFTFHNAGVASTGSTTGVFRFLRDAVTRLDGRPAPGATVVIVEAAVNDDQDERLTAADAGWGMEGIARMSRRGPSGGAPIAAFGGPEVLFVHFPSPAILEALRSGREPISVTAHERVAERYDLPSVNVAAAVARRIDAGTLTWEQYGGTHPGPVGHQLAADLIVEAIARSVAPETREDRAQHARRHARLRNRGKLPSGPLHPRAVDRATLRPPEDLGDGLKTTGPWIVGVPDWPTLPGRCRERFVEKPLLFTAEQGATLTADPTVAPFTTLALYVLAGPDAGAVDVKIGDGEPERIELSHRFSEDLHYPRTVLLYRGAEPPGGPVTVTTAEGKRGGTAVRIVGVGVGAKRVAE